MALPTLRRPAAAPSVRRAVSIRNRATSTLCLAFALAAALAAASYVLLDHALTGVDDANIYLAYGSNVAAGHGFVYNAGRERVEGFTSPAWTLITAAAFQLAPAFPERVLFVTSIFLVAMTWFVLIRFLYDPEIRGTRGHPLAIAFLLAAWCGSSPAYGLWMTTSLMETVLWSFTISAGAVFFARLSISDRRASCWLAATLAAGAVLVRPEALAIVPMWIATTFLVMWAVQGRIGRPARAVLPAIALFSCAVLALTAFRLAYFGYPLPNTYYAKLSSDTAYNLLQGMRYLRNFAVSYPLTLPLLAGSAALVLSFSVRAFAARRTRSSDDPWLEDAAPWTILAISTLGVMSLPLVTGGDHFAGFRVVLPVYALLALPPLFFLSAFRSPARYAIVAMVVAAAFVLVKPGWLGDVQALRHEYHVAVRGRQLGTFLNEVMPAASRPSIGVIAAGGVATTYRGVIVDLMGLNNVKMGHSPGDRIGPKNHAAFSIPVFWDLQPELVRPTLLWNREELLGAGQAAAEKDAQYLRGLMSTPRFRERYRPIVIHRPGGGVFPSLLAYARVDWIARHADTLLWTDYHAALARMTIAYQRPH